MEDGQNITLTCLQYLGPRRLYDVEWPWRLRCQEVPVAPSAPRAPESRVFEP